MTPDRSALRVVIADDTPDLRTLLRLTLERAGIEVAAEAVDGLEAVEAALAHQPHALLLDLAMPRMDGLEAIPRIQTVAPHTKIVVLSGFEVEMMRDEALRRGAEAYLEKGCPPADVITTLRRVCGAESGDQPTWQPTSLKRSDLLSTLIHEVRNQMTLVDGYASTLLTAWGRLTNDQRLDYLQCVLRNAASLRALVDSVSAAELISAEALTLVTSGVRLADLTREVLEDQAAVELDHDYRLKVDDDVTVEADALRVRQVLTNLLSNAAKFSPAHTAVTVIVGADGEAGTVVVIDEGPGVQPEQRAALFQPFTRLGATAPGTGLGLYISREIARAHGGDLSLVDATAGAAFRLRLPARVETSPRADVSDHEIASVEGE